MSYSEIKKKQIFYFRKQQLQDWNTSTTEYIKNMQSTTTNQKRQSIQNTVKLKISDHTVRKFIRLNFRNCLNDTTPQTTNIKLKRTVKKK